jgi:hypothetical protein
MRILARLTILIAALVGAGPVSAQTMNADAARRFVVGKLFAFSCFDGSRGLGRIYGDGSVIGTIQQRGSGPARSVWMPAGTLKVKGDAVCAALKGMPFEPCFNLNKMDERSFRGSVSGLGFAYCDFTRRVNVAGTSSLPPSPKPPSSDATTVALRGAN